MQKKAAECGKLVVETKEWLQLNVDKTSQVGSFYTLITLVDATQIFVVNSGLHGSAF